jgi:protein required for attachment to host cells
VFPPQQEKEDGMPRRRVTWFVLADGSRARFVTRRAEGPGYEIVAEYAAPEAQVPNRDIMSDRPGRQQESATSAHHGVEPRSDAHRERKAAFAQQVADRVNAAAAQGAFDELVIYAAPRALADLRNALGDAARAKLKAEFAKDLTKIPLAELPRHFAELP